MLYGIMITQMYLYYTTYKRYGGQITPGITNLLNLCLLGIQFGCSCLCVCLIASKSKSGVTASQVLAVFVVDTVNTLFDVLFVYMSLVKHFGKP